MLARPEVAELKPTVPLAEYTREVELLTVVGDLLQGLNHTAQTIARRGRAPSYTPSPLPRPRTALDRARDRRREARMDALLAEVAEAQVRWTQVHGEERRDG